MINYHTYMDYWNINTHKKEYNFVLKLFVYFA